MSLLVLLLLLGAGAMLARAALSKRRVALVWVGALIGVAAIGVFSLMTFWGVNRPGFGVDCDLPAAAVLDALQNQVAAVALHVLHLRNGIVPALGCASDDFFFRIHDHELRQIEAAGLVLQTNAVFDTPNHIHYPAHHVLRAIEALGCV